MCSKSPHKCYCGVEFECKDPNWVCPTINGDEDGNLCPTCYDKMVKEIEDYYESNSDGT